MAYSKTCRNPHLSIDRDVLSASCLNKFGGHVLSKIDLNQVLGVVNGVFVWGRKNFTHSVKAIVLREDGHTLAARLLSSKEDDPSITVDLDEGIANNGGKLEAINIPAIIGVPFGDEVKVAIDQLAASLNRNRKWKISRYDESEETTFFYLNASAENQTDTIIKTKSAAVTTALIHAVDATGTSIEQISVDVFQAEAVMKYGYYEEEGKHYATYIGAGASLNLIKAQASVFDLTLGVGVTTGIGIEDGSLELEIAGCGLCIGKRIALSFLGSEIGIDFGKFFN